MSEAYFECESDSPIGYALAERLGLAAFFDVSGDDGSVFFLEDGKVLKVTNQREDMSDHFVEDDGSLKEALADMSIWWRNASEDDVFPFSGQLSANELVLNQIIDGLRWIILHSGIKVLDVKYANVGTSNHGYSG